MTAHAHHETGAGGSSHGTVKSYIVGFIISAVLTIIPFWLVMEGVLPHGTTIIAIMVLAAIQVVVQLVFFLHMDRSSEQRWNILSFVFTAMVLIIVIGGSVWVMHNMNANMLH
ncbi:MAG: Cytochrome bo(3) ubiquinol oxidase subunit 4 [Paracidovorax wautersii]|uniref:Cytochrome bo(3) ubiquinol oxidase subunit 4 n=1 Tax=Paracidovorax wautersii TaxID=1177982 RepID=A0A7V8FMX3_9BURK|nr:MAG: Cytochrome bo(3) ubiquinol oxidase subunit 4 [Paracidovorax wautersii]